MLLPSWLASLKMEAAGFPKTLAPTNQSTQCHITEDSNFHRCHCQNPQILLRCVECEGNQPKCSCMSIQKTCQVQIVQIQRFFMDSQVLGHNISYQILKERLLKIPDACNSFMHPVHVRHGLMVRSLLKDMLGC